MAAAGAAGAEEKEPEYFFVGFVQAHGLIPNPSGVQTRTKTLDYGTGKNNHIDMTVLSIAGDQYISGKMGPMYWPPPDKRHWLGLSTELVLPGVLRDAFMDKCDNIADIREAFRVGTDNARDVYDAAHIRFIDGFTEQHNPTEDQYWQLERSPGENCRKTPGELPKRAVADRFQVMPNNEYGMHCICTNHPGLKPWCLTSITDDEVRRVSQKGHTDIISPRFYPSRNMIGHDDAPKPNPLGAANWISAIEVSTTDQELKKQAIEIILKAHADKKLFLQHFIIVLQALGIRHAWLYNPTCRNLCEELDPVRLRPPSPPHNEFPDSISERSPSLSPSPSPPPTTPPGGTSFLGFFNPLNLFKDATGSISQPRDLDKASGDEDSGYDEHGSNQQSKRYKVTVPFPGGGSRKSRKRTTVRRKKITRKTKKRAYKKKSQKRNRRK